MPWIDFSAVKDLVPMSAVLSLIGWTPNRIEPSSLRGKCPLHHSGNPKPSRSFEVNLEKSLFHCWNKSCNQKGDQIRLYAMVNRLSMYEAARKLCEVRGIPVPLKKSGTEMRHG